MVTVDLTEAYNCAALLSTLINDRMRSVGMKRKAHPLEAWAADIEKLHRIDGVDYDTIRKVIEWCQNDTFWMMNILSGNKLRKQFFRLIMQMKSEAEGTSEPQKNWGFMSNG